MGFRLMNGHTADQMSYACVISKRHIWLETCQINLNFELQSILAMSSLLKVCRRGDAFTKT